MGFSEMVVPASYAPIFGIVFESCPFPPRDGQIPPGVGGGGIPPRLGTTGLQHRAHTFDHPGYRPYKLTEPNYIRDDRA